MRRDLIILLEMIDAGVRIERLIGNRDLASFASDEVSRDAVLWNFTILGEAANQVSEALKATHPEVAWAAPVRLRNRIVHGYWGVDLSIIHTAVFEAVPILVTRLRDIAATLPEDAE